MKTIKTSLKKGAVTTVKAIACPLHLTLQAATNIVYAIGSETCHKVEQAEGYLVEHIDGTPRLVTSKARYDYTQSKMLAAGLKIIELKQMAIERLENNIKDIKDVANDTVGKVKREFTQPKEDVLPLHLEFQYHELMKQVKIVEEDSELSKSERNSQLRKLNGLINANRKLMPLPKVDPKDAFETPSTDMIPTMG